MIDVAFRDVAFSCDENGSDYLTVAVWSLLKNYRGEIPLRINVFEGFGGHSEATKSRLKSIVERFGSTLRYHNIEPVISPFADLILKREKSRWNVFTWAPIFTPLVLSDAVGPVIHFDIDMLFNADISPLFEIKFGERLIACSYEYHRCVGKVESAIWAKGILPEAVDRYFNTGVLVFNTEACRAERTWEKIINWYRDHYVIADRIEQDGWNALYHDRVAALDIRWNFHDRNMKGYAKWNQNDRYWLGNSPESCLRASLNPAILHFWGPKKPWKKSHRPYRKLYHEAMREVGLKLPKEPLLAPYYNLVNAIIKARIRWRCNEWVRRERWKAFKALLLAPFEWLGILLGLVAFTFLPHRLLIMVCDFVSSVYWAFDFRGRKIAAKNLGIMFAKRQFSDSVRRLIIRRSYRNMVRTIGYAFWTMHNARERAAKAGEMSEAAKRFLAENRPAITVSGHLGCWEILSQLAFLEGHTMMSVAKDIGTGGMTRLLMKARKSIGQEIVPAMGAFKPLMQGLKDGKSLGLLVDQNVSPRKGGIWIKFFGRDVPVSAAPAFFSAKGKANIVVAWSRPLKDGRYRCEYITEHGYLEARDIRGMTQTILDELSLIIRRHPSCWVLNYDYFARSL